MWHPNLLSQHFPLKFLCNFPSVFDSCLSLGLLLTLLPVSLLSSLIMVLHCVKCGFVGKGLFGLPKEDKIVAEWLAILQVTEKLKNHHRICFKHFSKHDYYTEVSRFVLRKGAKPLGPGDYSSEVPHPLEEARAILPKDTRIVVLPQVRRLQCQVFHCGSELTMFVSHYIKIFLWK